ANSYDSSLSLDDALPISAVGAPGDHQKPALAVRHEDHLGPPGLRDRRTRLQVEEEPHERLSSETQRPPAEPELDSIACAPFGERLEEHTSELQSRENLVF